MMVDEHLAASCSLYDRRKGILTRRSVEIATYYQICRFYCLLAEFRMTCVHPHLLKPREERQIAGRLIRDNDSDVLAKRTKEMHHAQGATYGITIGTDMARENDIRRLLNETSELLYAV